MISNQILATLIKAPESAGVVPDMAGRLGGGMVTLLIGLAVTFFGLVCLIFIIKIQDWARRGLGRGRKAAPEMAEAQPVQAVALPSEPREDPNLIAVIGAAVAACEAAPGARLVVRSVRRIGGAQTPWQSAAREEAMAR